MISLLGKLRSDILFSLQAVHLHSLKTGLKKTHIASSTGLLPQFCRIISAGTKDNKSTRRNVGNLIPTRFVTSVGKSQGKIVILGSGWAGFKVLKKINQKKYDVHVVSPRNYFVFTPLLASTSVGTLEFRCIVEPVKQHAREATFYEAWCDNLDLEKQQILCTSNLGDKNEKFLLDYDILVISVGAYSNTFNVPGVKENALFLKDINDARAIRHRVIERFEQASQPGTSEKDQLALLHFAVIGGGPTGIEFSGELHDFISDDISRLYPSLVDKVQMTVYDVAPKILSSFDSSLEQYVTKRFMRRGIKIRTGAVIEEVRQHSVMIKGQGEEPTGLVVWATGLTENPLISAMEGQAAKDNRKRLLTDRHLRVLNPFDKKPIDNVYALGDCATIEDLELPATAQVAKQKGEYLVKALNRVAKEGTTDAWNKIKPFDYQHMGSMAYVGGWKAIVELGPDKKNEIKHAGWLSWLFWRSAYFTMSVSNKNKVLIPMYWFLTWIFGRDISRF
ncbi:NDE1, mitochondrial external NADH dehydrogenase [Basidiobolus meristosporus CBS 931.73]|uniref:NDE1, mitochondrial external NADH dehydrogenase n=1 Tax=Basidiobolus meristosporus CBS 931.73 TaxID=1314790 RepID=A0A1Y1Y239_9FUNG|nr:NDE1, mitochondrial external NADH dehydrogenase [Basidiobolus meristosporus CBS 931.73]|eukprot:ORX92029.1 NDE1, mitochondrial external NADH dehydrogenase [Basidiobolus meristosporus CBS 931.73]